MISITDIKVPTPVEVSAIKADCAKRFPGCLPELIELDAPINAAVVVARFDLPSWSEYVDAQGRDLDTSHIGALVDRRLWPTLDEVTQLREDWPAAPKLIAKKLHEAAGEQVGRVSITRFSPSMLPKGLTPEKAAALVAAAEGAALWTARLPGGQHVLIMQSPLADVYLAAKAADRAAGDRNVGRISALLTYAVESVVLSAEPIDQLLNRLPGLASDVRIAYLEMGGEGAATRSKSL
jgi:hypothetical protein